MTRSKASTDARVDALRRHMSRQRSRDREYTAFDYKPFSLKQKKVLTWWLPNSPMRDMEGIICDGSIRAGKTVAMSLSFGLWSMTTFNQENFILCGKTIGSLRRNVVTNWKRQMRAQGYRIKDKRSESLIIISKGDVTNFYYLFGGNTEASQDLVQGITAAGALFDEVALMPQSFVEQAVGRCSIDGSKFWFNCNPDHPEHWFKKEWIDKLLCNKPEGAPLLDNDGNPVYKNLLHIHFTMDDNPSLSEKIKLRYRAMHSGVFFKRFIMGLWAVAEGLVYQQFADDPDKYTVDLDAPERIKEHLGDVQFVSIGVDFGGTRSLTTFVASAVHQNYSKITYIADANIKGKKGDIDAERLCNEFIEFVKKLRAKYPHLYIKYVFADSEAQYLINSLRSSIRKSGLQLNIGDSAKCRIIDRIVAGNTLLNTGRMFISRDCELVRGGLRSATWDKKKPDTRLDNFSTDIDILDAAEYSWERFMPQLCPSMKLERDKSWQSATL